MNSIVRPRPPLQVAQQVDDLRLDRDVERRDRLVGDDESRARARARGRCRCAGAGRRRIRAHSGPCASAGSSTAASARSARATRSARVPMPWMPRPSVRISPIVIRGDRLAKGSWKMYWMRGAQRASPRGREAPVMSAPSKRRLPAVGSISRAAMRPIVVLPLPDSPTRPTTSPRRDVEGDVLHGADDAARGERRSAAKCLVRPRDLEERRVGHRLRARCQRMQRLELAPSGRLERRKGGAAGVDRKRAARREGAALRQVGEARDHAGDRRQRRRPRRGARLASPSLGTERIRPRV